jgi:hypothetical protein
MSPVKYKQYYDLMMQQNADAFAEFKKIHDAFEKDQKKWKTQFNEVGLPITDIIRDWEHRLCSGMERGKYANYSAKLAEQFQQEIKKTFPLIDLVGVE